jgi:DNA polymerase V
MTSIDKYNVKKHQIALPLLDGLLCGTSTMAFIASSDLDINEYVIDNSIASFYAKVSGDSMQNAGIYDGDMVLVDRAKAPKTNDIVIAVVDQEFTIKRLMINGPKIQLNPENDKYKPIKINNRNSLTIWGVVSAVIKRL